VVAPRSMATITDTPSATSASRRWRSLTVAIDQSRAGGPLTDSGVRKIVARAGAAAGLPFPVHPHMLRHATGYKLANDGQDTRAIQHILGIGILPTRRATRTSRQTGSRHSGGTEGFKKT
jgi:site-specific recombinase XerC